LKEAPNGDPVVPEPPAPEASDLDGPSASTTDTDSAAAPWVPPVDGACPSSHPVKVKESSGIFHLPNGLAYDRTTPDRCYRDSAAAEADGYRQAKR
jgi:hypothetical protein